MAIAASPLLSSDDLDALPIDPRYSSRKPAALAACDGPLLARTWADDPAIDYIGRWDNTQTARWAGSSLRFRFDGPLLFLVPGKKTLASEYPMVGWQIDGKTYTSHARRGVSIRLWPPEGVSHPPLPVTPDATEKNQYTAMGMGALSSSSSSSSLSTRPTLTGSRQSTSSNLNLSMSTGLMDAEENTEDPQATPTTATFPSLVSGSQLPTSPTRSSTSTSDTSRLIEISLIDWGSVLQIRHFEMLAGSRITPAYPNGLANLPTLLFIGDSATSGYNPAPGKSKAAKEYSGFLDAYPAQLRSMLAPGVRISAVAFPGISLVDDPGEDNGMESKFFKVGPLEIDGSNGGTKGGLLNNNDNDDDNDWGFEDREDESAPTHIFVNLGNNENDDDTCSSEKFLSTLESFVNLLKETYGRRTGDIMVMAPFGRYTSDHPPSSSAQQDEVMEGVNAKSQTRYTAMKRKIEEISQQWLLEDPLASGDFPATPIFELTRAQLEQSEASTSVSDHTPDSSSNAKSRPTSLSNSAAFAAALKNYTDSSSNTTINLVKSSSMTSINSLSGLTRPSLIVRPSSIAAGMKPNERGTKTKLHFIDTWNWLYDEKEDYMPDGIHPSKKGARKIAKKLKNWLGDNGFLAGASS